MLWSLCCIHGSVCCPQRLNNTEKLRQLISTDQIRHHHLRPGGSLQCYKHNSCEASFPASVQRVDGLLPLICSTIFAMAQWTGVFDLDGVCHVGEMISAPADVLKGRSLDSESRCQSKGPSNTRRHIVQALSAEMYAKTKQTDPDGNTCMVTHIDILTFIQREQADKGPGGVAPPRALCLKPENK